MYDHNTNLFFCDNFTALSTTDVRILTSLAELWLVGNAEPPRPLVQMMLKFKSIGSLNNLLPHLERKGVITRPSSSTVAITAAGLQRPEIRALEPPTNNLEHHSNIKSHLNPKQIEIFSVLIDGKVHNRSEVASGLGYASHKGHFRNTLSGMKGLGIISYPTSNEVQLTDMCFILALGSMAPEMTPASSAVVVSGGASSVRKAQTSGKVIAAKKLSQTKHALPVGASVPKVPLVTKDPSPSTSPSRLHVDTEPLKKKYLRLLLNFHSHHEPGHPLRPLLTPMVLIMLAGNKNLSTKIVSEALKQLNDEGLINYHGKGDSRVVLLTPTGEKTAATLGVDHVPNNLAVLNKISAVLGNGTEGKMFEALRDRSWLPKADVGRALGYTCTGTKKFTKTVKILKSKGLLNSVGGNLQLTGACFPFGKDDDDADQFSANPDAAYDADTDVESYDKKPAAISNVVPVEPPTASSIDLTHSDEDDEDVDRITTIVLTSSGDESGWDPIAIADAQAAESADGGVFLSV